MKKIGFILLSIIIIVFNFIIGANEKGLRIIPISVLMTTIVVYLVLLKIIKKENSIFFKGKIDYIVLTFMCITALPLIFKTYASYSDTIEFLVKYFFIYSVYILSRNILNTKKDIEHIITIILISSIIPVVLEFGYLHIKAFNGVMQWLDLVYETGAEFDGTFGYANAQAIYMAFCIFLSAHKIYNSSNKKIKIINIVYIVLASYILLRTKCLTIIAILIIFLGIYLFRKYRNVIKEHIYIFILAILVILAIVIGFLVFALNTSKDINTEKSIDQIIKYDFKPNETYNIELEFDAKNDGTAEYLKNSAFIIKIYDVNKYFNEFLIKREETGSREGVYKIEFTPTKDTTCIRVVILNDFNGKMHLGGKCKINGNDVIINYKYIPNEIGYVFSGFLLNGKSIRQRAFMYQDCLKIAANNTLIGNGGNAWKNLSYTVQDSPYNTKETHSYLLELLISYGLIGVCAFLAMIVYFFVIVFKKCKNNKDIKKEKLLIIIGLLIVIIHSACFDFEMSFMLIQILVYVCMAILLYDIEDKTKNVSFADYIVFVLLAIILSIPIRGCIAEYFVQDVPAKNEIASYNKKYNYSKITNNVGKSYINKIKDIQEFIQKEPYYMQTNTYNLYFTNVLHCIDNLTNDELSEFLNFGINKLNTIKHQKPMFLETLLDRAKMLKKVIEKLESYANEIEDNNRQELVNKKITEIKEIINKEYEANLDNINDTQRNGFSKQEINAFASEYLSLINSINE